MTASVVPNGFVSEAMSKTVSGSIGSGCGTRAREPHARCRSTSSPRPTSTTTPGISPEATTSVAAASTPEKSKEGPLEAAGRAAIARNTNPTMTTAGTAP